MIKEPVLFRCRKNGGGVMKTQVYCLKDHGICFRVFRKRYHKRITKRWFSKNYRPFLDEYYITTTLNEENILKKQMGYKVSDILLTGDTKKINEWLCQQSLIRTEKYKNKNNIHN